MIARIWRGITLNINAEEYLIYLFEKVVPSYQMAMGNRGIFIFRDAENELVSFLLLSFWDSQESLMKFMELGADPARQNPEGESLLLAFESMANHYEMVPVPERTGGHLPDDRSRAGWH